MNDPKISQSAITSACFLMGWYGHAHQPTRWHSGVWSAAWSVALMMAIWAMFRWHNNNVRTLLADIGEEP